MPLKFPPRKPGITNEEYSKEIKKAFEEARRQRRKRSHEYIRLMVREAWKRELRISERQWKIIEPKYEKVQLVSWTTWAGSGYGGKDEQSFRWIKSTEDRGGGFPLPKTPDELTEGEKIVEELIDLMRKERASNEEIRQKIDALQRVREKAKKELPKAKKELAAVLTTPRQEAVLLLMGSID
jgi:hypothetical protein